MPTYVYETVPVNADEEPRQFEFFQRMSDEPLKVHPDSKEPVRKIIAGVFAMKRKMLNRGTVVNKKSAAATACGCGSSGHNHSHGHSHSAGHHHHHH